MAGIRIYDNTFVDAAALLERALVDAEHNPPLLVQTLMSLAFAQGMAGQFEASLRNARDAVTHAEAMRAAGQSCTRDVGQHDVPVRTRHRRA